MTQPWKGYNKRIDNFDKDFESALTSLVLAQEYPQSLSHLSQGAIDIINQHKDILPDVMKKVQFALVKIITISHPIKSYPTETKIFSICRK